MQRVLDSDVVAAAERAEGCPGDGGRPPAVELLELLEGEGLWLAELLSEPVLPDAFQSVDLLVSLANQGRI